MAHAWISSLYSAPQFVTRKVGDRELHFYAISPATLIRLRPAAKSIAGILANFFSAAASGNDSRLEDVTNADGSRRTVSEPVSVDMAKYRDAQREAASKELIETLTNFDNNLLLAEVILESLREEQGKPTAPEFIKQVDATLLPVFAAAALEANKEVLGPLEKRVTDALKALGA